MRHRAGLRSVVLAALLVLPGCLTRAMWRDTFAQHCTTATERVTLQGAELRVGAEPGADGQRPVLALRLAPGALPWLVALAGATEPPGGDDLWLILRGHERTTALAALWLEGGDWAPDAVRIVLSRDTGAAGVPRGAVSALGSLVEPPVGRLLERAEAERAFAGLVLDATPPAPRVDTALRGRLWTRWTGGDQRCSLLTLLDAAGRPAMEPGASEVLDATALPRLRELRALIRCGEAVPLARFVAVPALAVLLAGAAEPRRVEGASGFAIDAACTARVAATPPEGLLEPAPPARVDAELVLVSVTRESKATALRVAGCVLMTPVMLFVDGLACAVLGGDDDEHDPGCASPGILEAAVEHALERAADKLFSHDEAGDDVKERLARKRRR